MQMFMSIKEYMKGLNTLNVEYQLLTIETNLNEFFNILKQFIKKNLLKKSATKKFNLLTNLKIIKSTMRSALFAYNEQIYSSDEKDKKLSNEELIEAIESTIKSSDKDIEVPHSSEKII